MTLNFLTNSSYTVFLTTSFSTSSLNLLKSTGVVLIEQYLISLFYFSNCLNYLIHVLINQYLVYQLLILRLQNLFLKSSFSANFDVSMPVAFFEHNFVA